MEAGAQGAEEGEIRPLMAMLLGEHEGAVCAGELGGLGRAAEDGGGPDQGGGRVRGEEGGHGRDGGGRARCAGRPVGGWWRPRCRARRSPRLVGAAQGAEEGEIRRLTTILGESMRGRCVPGS